MSDTAIEPVWKKYAYGPRRRRAWTDQDRKAHEKANENYQKVVDAVMDEGLSWRQAGLQFELPENVVSRIAWRWRQKQKTIATKRKWLAEADWANGITERFKERLLEVSESKDGISVEKYNQMKVGQTHLKGVGIYQVGDHVTNFNQQNNFLSISEEEAAKLLRLAGESKKRPTVLEATIESNPDGSAAGRIGEDSDRPALVGAALDKNIES